MGVPGSPFFAFATKPDQLDPERDPIVSEGHLGPQGDPNGPPPLTESKVGRKKCETGPSGDYFVSGPENCDFPAHMGCSENSGDPLSSTERQSSKCPCLSSSCPQAERTGHEVVKRSAYAIDEDDDDAGTRRGQADEPPAKRCLPLVPVPHADPPSR